MAALLNTRPEQGIGLRLIIGFWSNRHMTSRDPSGRFCQGIRGASSHFEVGVGSESIFDIFIILRVW